MYATEQIERLAGEIAERFCTHRIILFGSYAYGKPRADSDVDLLVLTECSRGSVSKAVQIRRAIDAPFPLDLLVRTSEEFEKRLALGDQFMREIAEKGRVLYEGADAGVGEKGRGRLRKRAARSSGAKGPQLRRRGVSRSAVR